MKVSELTGAQLDYWTGMADDDSKEYVLSEGGSVCFVRTGIITAERYSPSTDWSRGGLIAERERMQLNPLVSGGAIARMICPGNSLQHIEQHGDTYLIAICRCKVANAFGLEVSK